MANFTEMGSGMPNIFNFIPEAGKSGSGINDLAGLLALEKKIEELTKIISNGINRRNEETTTGDVGDGK